MNDSYPRRLVFHGKQKVSLDPFKLDRPMEGQLLVRTRLSMMSTGTENIVFNRSFDVGTHWDGWVKYPFFPGYTAVGIVEEIGPKVQNYKEGDRVAYRVPHCSHAIIEAEKCFPIPSNISFENAIWFSLAKIAFHGISAAQCGLGDSIMIIGAGPIGQMSTRWARAAGAPIVIALDMEENRLAHSRRGGATSTISNPLEKSRAAIEASCLGHLPGIVIDTTGNASVLSAALTLVADRGRVVILGDTGQPTKQTLTADVLTRGLTIVGTHDVHDTSKWNARTITKLFFDLVSTERFDVTDLISHEFHSTECVEAYTVANNSRGQTMGIAFNWK